MFGGNGYSDDWQIEAAARGLPNLRTTLDALPELISEPAMELFEKYGVFTHREMHSRYEIALEQYSRSIGVEARSTLEIGTTAVLPAAVRYQTEVALNLGALKKAGVTDRHRRRSKRSRRRSPTCGRHWPRSKTRWPPATGSSRRPRPSTPATR